MVALTPTYPLLPGHNPVVNRGFYISGSLVVFLIVMTVLGGVYLCGMLVYTLISYFSTRYLSPWVKGGALVGNWNSGATTPERERQNQMGRDKPGTGLSVIIWGQTQVSRTRSQPEGKVKGLQSAMPLKKQ